MICLLKSLQSADPLPGRIAALMYILGAEDHLQRGLAEQLASLAHADATRAPGEAGPLLER